MTRFPLIAGLIFTTHIAFAAGHPLVPATTPDSSDQVVVTATPSGYLIGWLQLGAQPHIMAARLGRDATSLDGPGIVLASATNDPNGYLPRLAVVTTGSRSLLTWIDNGGDAGVHAAIFNDDHLTFLTPQPFIVSRNVNTHPYKIPDPVISAAWNGHEFLVVWTNDNVIFETFVRPDGSVHGERTLYTDPSEGISAVRLIFDGQRFVLAWTAVSCYGCNFERHAVAARLSTDGDLLEAPLTIANDASLVDAASGHAGEVLAVVAGDHGDSGIFLSTNGPLSARAPFPMIDWRYGAAGAVTFDGDRYLVALAYEYVPAAPSTLRWLALTRIGRDGTVEPLAITKTPALISPGIAVIPSGPVLITGSAGFGLDPKRLLGYFPSELSVMTPPAPPRNVRFIPGEIVTWDDASDDEEGFGVTFCTAKVGCTTYAITANSTASRVPFADTYSVTAFNGAGESQAVPAVSAGTGRRHATR